MYFFCALRRTTLGAFTQPCMHACNLGSGLVTAHVYCNHRDSLIVCHQGLSLHVSCPHRLAEPEHPSTAAKAGGTLRILALSSPPCLATPHRLLGLGPWPYVRLRMLNARSHSAAFTSRRDSALTRLHAPRAPRLRRLPTGLPGQALLPANLQWLPPA